MGGGRLETGGGRWEAGDGSMELVRTFAAKIKRMRSFIQLSGLAFVIVLFTACGTATKIESLKPAANYSADIVYEKQVSYLNLPIEITVADLQNQVNKYFNGLIYEDNKIEDDNLMMKVWKQAPIVMNERNGKLDIVLPLKIWLKVRYGFDKFGITAYDTKELNLNGTVKLTTLPVFKNWKFTTTTEITGFDWTEAPSINIAGNNVPITYLVNPAIALFKNKIARSIDESIAQSMDIKPYVLGSLDQISKPMELNKDYHVWFAMQPLELYTNPAVIANKKVTVTLGMKAYMETTINGKPTIAFDKNKLLLMGAEKLNNDFGITIAGIVTYPNAAALMQTNFNGKRFESGSRAVTINKIDLWGKDGKMIVELGMTGSVNGEFYLSGIPVYDPLKKEIFLDQVDFVLDSKNKLLKLGDWLGHGTIARKIQENCRFSIADQLTMGETNIKNYLNNYQPVKGVSVSGNLVSLNPQKVVLTPNAIITTIAAQGSAAIRINGMQ